jgi:hypothetical protein
VTWAYLARPPLRCTSRTELGVDRGADAVLLVGEEVAVTSSVVFAEECPSRACTSFTEAPERISTLAK